MDSVRQTTRKALSHIDLLFFIRFRFYITHSLSLSFALSLYLSLAHKSYIAQYTFYATMG